LLNLLVGKVGGVALLDDLPNQTNLRFLIQQDGIPAVSLLNPGKL
jgi:hypothetical protein